MKTNNNNNNDLKNRKCTARRRQLPCSTGKFLKREIYCDLRALNNFITAKSERKIVEGTINFPSAQRILCLYFDVGIQVEDIPKKGNKASRPSSPLDDDTYEKVKVVFEEDIFIDFQFPL